MSRCKKLCKRQRRSASIKGILCQFHWATKQTQVWWFFSLDFFLYICPNVFSMIHVGDNSFSSWAAKQLFEKDYWRENQLCFVSFLWVNNIRKLFWLMIILVGSTFFIHYSYTKHTIYTNLAEIKKVTFRVFCTPSYVWLNIWLYKFFFQNRGYHCFGSHLT